MGRVTRDEHEQFVQGHDMFQCGHLEVGCVKSEEYATYVPRRNFFQPRHPLELETPKKAFTSQ